MKKVIVMPDELHESLKEMARKKNLSINAIIRMALSEYIEINKKPQVSSKASLR